MFLNVDKHDQNKIAIKDDSGYSLTYADVCRIIEEFDALHLPRSVIFCLCQNCAGSLIGYMAFENNKQVPLLLSVEMDEGLRNNLESMYTPGYYWVPEEKEEEIKGEKIYSAYGYVLLKTKYEPYSLNDKLSMLLTTSGSTGSPKLVRHKYGNLEANAENVAKVFSWRPDEEVGICDLPMNYTMGLNVINSHLIVGASVLMVKANLMDPDFWEFIKVNGGTSFCGVPFSYEVMKRVGFDKMDLPKLYTLAEGGGKLTDKMFRWIATYAKNSGKRFCATFGTSETSARMAFLDPDLALKKIGSIGKAIPNGELFLLDEVAGEDGTVTGELGYRGPNVTMGYALNRDDLMKGDEFCGEYHTGDIAKRDADGFYFIIGRKGRFLKLFGLRVSLDETERILKTQYPNVDFCCTGDDKRMNIFVTDEGIQDEIVPFISGKTNLHNSAFKVFVIDEIPRNDYGKVKFAKLEKIVSKYYT
ncbi:MAG TPA: AMP-binding protein [Clostridiaceae bacterium]|nr:AMP-binding protein [Clostridiaceae bacterium]